MRDDERLPRSNQLIETATATLRGGSGLGVVASLAIVVISGIIAPGDAPGAWTWLRVLAIWLLVAVALAQVAGSASGHARPASPIFTWGALLAAIAIGLSFPALATALTVLGVIVLLLAAPTGARQPATFWAIVATVTPIWVWSAFEAWDRWVLLLAPVAAVGLVSLEHAARSAGTRSGLPQRVAAWIGLLAIAAATLLVALLAGIDPSWVTLAAIVTVALAAADLAIARRPLARLPAMTLPGVALQALALGWLAAL